jgi:hypothetical protein
MLIKKKLYWLIAVATLVRCIAAVSVDLGNDEVYYLSYAYHLQWNYFDHPPMVAVLIRITTFNLNFTSEFFVRLGPIILSALNKKCKSRSYSGCFIYRFPLLQHYCRNIYFTRCTATFFLDLQYQFTHSYYSGPAPVKTVKSKTAVVRAFCRMLHNE